MTVTVLNWFLTMGFFNVKLKENEKKISSI